MNRKLKGFGLALVAALALSGVVALAAHAETKIESTLAAPAVTTVDVANDSNLHGSLARSTIGNGARFIECTSVKLSGITFAGSITTATGTPEFSECFTNNLTNAPVTHTHNGCKVKLTALVTKTASKTLECPAGQQMEVHLFENVKAREENKPLCTYDVKPQTLTGATVKTAGAAGSTHSLTIELAGLTKTKLTNTGPGGLAICGIAAGKEGESAMSGSLVVTGTDSFGKQVGITVG